MVEKSFLFNNLLVFYELNLVGSSQFGDTSVLISSSPNAENQHFYPYNKLL